MKELKAMRSVYCYFFPEVRPLLREVALAIPDEMFLVTTSRDEVYGALKNVFNPPPDVPATPEGYIDKDTMHIPIMERVVKAYEPVVPGLNGFAHRYPTHGSSEGIYNVLARLKTQGVEEINILEGEYEGYQCYADHMGLRVKHHDIDTLDPKQLESSVWFVSNPSARDGNILPDNLVDELCEAGHHVYLDLAYVSSTKKRTFDVGHENIRGAFLSLSKPYGLFWFRIGFTFTRDDVPSLYGTKWFKDPMRLLQGLKVIETIGLEKLHPKYRPVQEGIVNRISEEFDIPMRPSDALLLAHITEEDAQRLEAHEPGMISQFKRGRHYRFCLTPYYEMWERGVE